MTEKVISLKLTDEEMAKRLFPDRETKIVGISKRIANGNRTSLGWIVEYTEKAKEF